MVFKSTIEMITDTAEKSLAAAFVWEQKRRAREMYQKEWGAPPEWKERILMDEVKDAFLMQGWRWTGNYGSRQIDCPYCDTADISPIKSDMPGGMDSCPNCGGWM